jgi:hypothetical protein
VTTQPDLPSILIPALLRARLPVPASRARRRPRGVVLPSLCAAMVSVGALSARTADAHAPRPPRAASTPSTAQILAPSVATVPDALPPERTIYRCGDSYSPHPCADAKPLNVDDARSADQRRQGEELATRDKRMASWLEAERRERDGAASAPAKTRARVATACVDTANVACEVRKPKVRRAKAISPPKAAPATVK